MMPLFALSAQPSTISISRAGQGPQQHLFEVKDFAEIHRPTLPS
jgi:hypothetical protein